MGEPALVADATAKALLLVRRRPAAVALWSGPAAPDMVGRGVLRAREARSLLGPRLGGVVLEPIAFGEAEGRTFAILPWRRPLSRSHLGWRLQRPMIAARVLGWLDEAARQTAAQGPSDFRTPLAHAEADAGLPNDLRADAAAALSRLERGAWSPRHVLDHNDLWKSNVLLGGADGAAVQITIIDWAGSNPAGFGVYDAVRFGKSMRLSPGTLHRVLTRQCAALGSDRADAMGHLLAAIGRLGMHLDQFPRERYATLAASCWRSVREADLRVPSRRGSRAA